jgi:hypothetical protein
MLNKQEHMQFISWQARQAAYAYAFNLRVHM